MIFFCHKNFNPHAARVLKAFDPQVEIELFPYQANVPDEEWIAVVGKSRPKRIVLSVDDGQIGNAVQRSYVRESGCTFVYLVQGWSNLEWSVYASKLVRAWPGIVEACKNLKGYALTLPLIRAARRAR